MFFWFIAVRFLKFVLIILLGLEFFFVSVDSLQYIDVLSSSANTAFLFLAFNAMYALNYVLPLSLILGLIVFYISLIRSNQYVALLSIGYSKKQIFFPPFLLINGIICCYIGLNATDFAYAQERVDSIARRDSGTISRDLFVRYNNDYVFFQKVYPLLQKAENIKIYHTTKQNSRELTSITQANEGYFDNNEWNLINPRVSTLPQSYALGQEGMQTKEYENIKILKGFRPKILDTFYNNKPIISLTDAIYSLKILLQEQADTKRTRGVLYTLGIVPFFISMLAVIIAYYAPPLARYGNLATLGIGLSVLSLIIWGLFFSLGKLNANAIFLPEVSMLLPLGILLIISIWCYNRLNKI